MKYLVQLRLKPGSERDAIDAFELRGPSRNPGVRLHQGWIDTKSHIVFVIIESSDAALVEKAAQSWAEFGESEIHPVVDIEQY